MQPAVPNFVTGFNNNWLLPPQNTFLSAIQQPAIIKLKPQQVIPQNPQLQQMLQNPQLQQSLQMYQNVPIQQQIMRGVDTLLQHLLYQSSRTLQNQISPLLLPHYKRPLYPNTIHIPVQQTPQVVKGPLMQQAPTRVQQIQQAGFQAQQNDRKV